MVCTWDWKGTVTCQHNHNHYQSIYQAVSTDSKEFFYLLVEVSILPK